MFIVHIVNSNYSSRSCIKHCSNLIRVYEASRTRSAYFFTIIHAANLSLQRFPCVYGKNVHDVRSGGLNARMAIARVILIVKFTSVAEVYLERYLFTGEK